ncbi:hypothetical protein MHO82_24715 [Vibrio sp. Of7-15]|uniref:hypothetical protein n=1 Tax=Vibrio sp. Of7-15 TaxID=2724879 RepID=UPI001EF3D154|nr:hypothetical protein [Vibrio sp. Of7-15]MCG7500071.1 hypothetical protein [Vibrio sp. Of7-15]
MFEIVVSVFGVLIVSYLCIYLPYAVIRSKKKLNQLSQGTALRQLTAKEQQILYLVYRRHLPIGPIFSVQGQAQVLAKRRFGPAYEFLIGPYRLTGEFVGQFIGDEAESYQVVDAEIFIHKNTAYIISANGRRLTDVYAAQWEARFAPEGPAKALNIDINGSRVIDTDERRQLDLPLKLSGNRFFLLGLVLFCLFMINAFGWEEEVLFAHGLPIVFALFVLPWVVRYRRLSCPFGRPCINRPGRMVTLAQGTIMGTDGKQVWFTGSADKAPQDPALCFTLPTLQPVTMLEAGQRIQFGFCPRPWVAQRDYEVSSSPQLVTIEGHFDAGQHYRNTPFMMRGWPLCVFLIGICPFVSTVPLLFDQGLAQSYLDSWNWVLAQLAVAGVWTLAGLWLLVRQFIILGRYTRQAKERLGSNYMSLFDRKWQ